MSYSYKENIGAWRWYDAESVTSTNDEIKNLLQDKQEVVLSAVHQTGGRGRRGRTWTEILGNLYFTYTYRIANKDLSKVVCIIAESLAQTITDINPRADVKIKWPNDVFLSGKKVSGILLENLQADRWAVGIGVNIKGAPNLIGGEYQATSLAENGIILDRTDFLHYYLKNFAQVMQEYRNDGFSNIKNRYLSRAIRYGEEINIKQENEIKTGIFSALDDNGYLILKTNQGEECIIAGDLFV